MLSQLVCVALLTLASLSARTIEGVWEITVVQFGELQQVHRATIQVAGERLTGRTAYDVKLEGTVRGGLVEFQARFPNGELLGAFSGTIQGNEMSGSAKVWGDQPASWTARRPVERPAGGPLVHEFTPSQFHRVFSSAIAPVLHIFPGDTVRTWSVDSGGRDAQGVIRAAGGNPLTGPFYIEGAMGGDTLVVRFNRIRLNRDSAQSGDSIAAHALSPHHFKELKPVEKFDSKWRLDRDRGVAVLANPTGRLKSFRVRLEPMLGCVGVAPPGRQSFHSGQLGPWGGNMDYNQIREGVTLYLPVFHPGALLFVGDGHAAQGDGELTGDALETSMDIEFTVELVEGKAPGTPRAENDEYLMAIGIGGSLADALERATSELARWLERDYKLNAAEVAIVLGTSMRYDIAEMVDPQVNVVAKVAKSVLAQLRP